MNSSSPNIVHQRFLPQSSPSNSETNLEKVDSISSDAVESTSEVSENFSKHAFQFLENKLLAGTVNANNLRIGLASIEKIEQKIMEQHEASAQHQEHAADTSSFEGSPKNC